MHRLAVSTTSFLTRRFASVGDFGLCWLVIGGLISALIVLSTPMPLVGSGTAAMTKFLAVGVWLGVMIGTVVSRRNSHTHR